MAPSHAQKSAKYAHTSRKGAPLSTHRACISTRRLYRGPKLFFRISFRPPFLICLLFRQVVRARE